MPWFSIVKALKSQEGSSFLMCGAGGCKEEHNKHRIEILSITTVIKRLFTTYCPAFSSTAPRLPLDWRPCKYECSQAGGQWLAFQTTQQRPDNLVSMSCWRRAGGIDNQKCVKDETEMDVAMNPKRETNCRRMSWGLKRWILKRRLKWRKLNSGLNDRFFA